MRERRQFMRVASPVLITFPDPTTLKTERSFTQDVSENGVRFPTGVKFQVGQEIPLTVELPFFHASLQTMGEVLWIREIARMGVPHYDVGVRFRWIEDSERQRLVRHLANFFPGRV